MMGPKLTNNYYSSVMCRRSPRTVKLTAAIISNQGSTFKSHTHTKKTTHTKQQQESLIKLWKMEVYE